MGEAGLWSVASPPPAPCQEHQQFTDVPRNPQFQFLGWLCGFPCSFPGNSNKLRVLEVSNLIRTYGENRHENQDRERTHPTVSSCLLVISRPQATAHLLCRLGLICISQNFVGREWSACTLCRPQTMCRTRVRLPWPWAVLARGAVPTARPAAHTPGAGPAVSSVWGVVCKVAVNAYFRFSWVNTERWDNWAIGKVCL